MKKERGSVDLFADPEEDGVCFIATDRRLWTLHARTRNSISFPLPRGADRLAASLQSIELLPTGWYQ